MGRLAQARTRLAVHGGLVGMLALAGVLAAAAMSPGCGSPNGGLSDGGEGDGAVCVPFNPAPSDFSNFTTWKNQYHLKTPFMLAPDGGPPDLVHIMAARDIYINLGSPGQPQCPKAGAVEFPVGTIIVKRLAQSGQPATDPGVFAQVKVGCGYNAGGASGWEWFDLVTPLNGGPPNSIEIVWQGTTPPTSQSYGGNPTECNVCHSLMGASNDSVITSALELKDFQCQ
jgi:hypothetical protein